MSNAFEGASHGRRMRGWNASSAGPNTAIGQSLDVLRRRSRDAARNSSVAASVLQTWTRSLVGFGIAARPNTTDSVMKAKLTALWSAWNRVADTDGGSFDGIQQTAVRAWLEAGEAFARFRPRRMEDALPVPMQVQLLEAEMLPLLDADVYDGLPPSNVIRQGIEIDPIGRRVAYWFYRQHPGDRSYASTVDSTTLVRVPADNVCHLFEPTRPGQLRGVPILAPILAKLRVLDDFDDAVGERQRLANLFTMFVTKPASAGGTDPMTDPMTGLPHEGTAAEPIGGMEPGSSVELMPGEDVRFSEPPGAGTDYDVFTRRQLLSLSAGIGVPYEILTGDIKDVSDRTLRLSVNEFRRACEAKIYGVIIPRFLDRVRAAWTVAGRIGGQISPAEYDTALDVTWAPPAWAPMHPTQDLQAMRLAVDAGFRSRSSVIAQFGDDPAAVDQERANDKERADSLGLQTADEAKTAAEVAKLEAEAAAAQKAADAASQQANAARAKANEAKASADALRAQQRTTEAMRAHDTAAASDRAKVARLEVQAAEIGMRELTGGKRP